MALSFPRFLLEPRWRVTGFLAVAAAVNYADRVAISAVFPALKEELHLSDVTLGLIGSLFLWSYALASPFAGMLADRFSRSLLVLLSLVVWSGVTGLTGIASGLLMLCILRVALGISESLYLPSAIALLADHHPPATRARAMSFHSMGLNLGVVAGGTCAGFLADHYGWRAGFWILGAAGLALAGFSRFFLSDAPRAKRLNATAGTAWSQALAPLRYFLRTPSFLILLGAEMLTGVTIWIFLNWLPLYFREAFDMSLGAAGFVGAVMLQGAMVTGIGVGGWISDKTAVRHPRRRMLLLALSYIAASPILLLFLTSPGFAVVVVTISGFSFLRGLGEANEKAALCEVVPVQFRSTALGCMNTLACAAGGVGVFLAGWFKKDLGLNAVFAASSGLLLFSGLSLFAGFWFFMRRDMERAQALE